MVPGLMSQNMKHVNCANVPKTWLKSSAVFCRSPRHPDGVAGGRLHNAGEHINPRRGLRALPGSGA
jgi:hypothetical protein